MAPSGFLTYLFILNNMFYTFLSTVLGIGLYEKTMGGSLTGIDVCLTIARPTTPLKRF